jgi:hypothetical protein
MEGTTTYKRGGARLGEKEESKSETSAGAEAGTPQSRRRQAAATTGVVSAASNCPAAKVQIMQE